MNDAREVLSVRDLRTYFYTDVGVAKAVDGVTFSVRQGGTLGIVGESGCGKSVSALSIMRLIAEPPGKIVSGEIYFEGKNLLSFSNREMKKIRGNRISMIFQDPMTSLNPVFKVGEQISEVLRLHQGLSKEEALERSIELLRLVEIPSPEKRINDYPHQMSGGMRQRVMIAMALSCKPQLMLADEPTTALDVTIQAQILSLIQELKTEIGMSVVLISHNLGIIAETAQNVAIMYAGKIMEYSTVDRLFENPCHPYTEGLIESIPQLDKVQEKLHVIPGIVPSILNIPQGCRFSTRCERSFEKCTKEEPPLFEISAESKCRCWLCE